MIQLNTLPTICVTIPGAKDRQARITKFAEENNYDKLEFLEGEISEDRSLYCVKVAETHKKAYSLYKPPFIVIEDDCVATTNYNNLIPEPPALVGAVYLGTSRYGMVQGKTLYDGAIASYTEDDFYIRPYNMLSQHAILFLDDILIEKYISLLDLSIQNREGSDNNIARQMKNLNVVATAAPLFYQQDGHSDAATNTPILPRF